MYHNLIDEIVSRMLKTVGIEYDVSWNDTAIWSYMNEGSDITIWIGKLEVMVSKVHRKATVVAST